MGQSGFRLLAAPCSIWNTPRLSRTEIEDSLAPSFVCALFAKHLLRDLTPHHEPLALEIAQAPVGRRAGPSVS